MSDPVSNAEIEDVLSSIRRLVSEEPNSARRRKPPSDAGNDRLVLTQDQRISDDSREDWEPEAEDDPDLMEIVHFAPDDAAEIEDAEYVDPDIEEEDSAASLHRRAEELEAALMQAGGEWEPDGSEDYDEDEARPLSADTGFDMNEAWNKVDSEDTDSDRLDTGALAETPEGTPAEPGAPARPLTEHGEETPGADDAEETAQVPTAEPLVLSSENEVETGSEIAEVAGDDSRKDGNAPEAADQRDPEADIVGLGDALDAADDTAGGEESAAVVANLQPALGETSETGETTTKTGDTPDIGTVEDTSEAVLGTDHDASPAADDVQDVDRSAEDGSADSTTDASPDSQAKPDGPEPRVRPMPRKMTVDLSAVNALIQEFSHPGTAERDKGPGMRAANAPVDVEANAGAVDAPADEAETGHETQSEALIDAGGEPAPGGEAGQQTGGPGEAEGLDSPEASAGEGEIDREPEDASVPPEPAADDAAPDAQQAETSGESGETDITSSDPSNDVDEEGTSVRGEGDAETAAGIEVSAAAEQDDVESRRENAVSEDVGDPAAAGDDAVVVAGADSVNQTVDGDTNLAEPAGTEANESATHEEDEYPFGAAEETVDADRGTSDDSGNRAEQASEEVAASAWRSRRARPVGDAPRSDEARPTVDTLYADATEETVIDEEALRDLVAKIVREELQGVLGERITRNVRRMVRREIERAIAMRELD